MATPLLRGVYAIVNGSRKIAALAFTDMSGTVTNAQLGTDAVTNVKVSATADISGSKIQSLSVGANAGVIPSTGVADAHVSATAAISGSKLQALSVGANAGAIPSTGIVNAHIAAGAAIVGTKLETAYQRNAASGIAAVDVTREIPHHIKKAASANARNSHNAEIAGIVGDGAAYVKQKTITLTNGLIGAARFLFDLKSDDNVSTVKGRIYRNGVALGTEQTTTSSTYSTKSEDLTQTWAAGDTAELWVVGGAASATASVRNFQIAYDDSASVAVASANS